MTLLSLPWQLINRARRALYRRGVLKSHRLPRPVISIGNLSAGGSGKTPLVIWAARRLVSLGHRVTILTRGYRRAGGEPWVIVNELDAVRFGDEPVLIQTAVPDADVVVGGDRFLSATRYLERQDCDVFLMDDGFQHIQLHRDLDIVIVDERARWLREGTSALRDADVIVVREHDESRRLVGAFTVGYSIVATAVRHDGEVRGVDWLADRPVVAFAGLGNNEQFFESVRALGARVAATRGFPDHHSYTTGEIEELRAVARAHDAVPLTTEKDLVKISVPGIAAIVIEAVVESEDEVVSRMVDVVSGTSE